MAAALVLAVARTPALPLRGAALAGAARPSIDCQVTVARALVVHTLTAYQGTVLYRGYSIMHEKATVPGYSGQQNFGYSIQIQYSIQLQSFVVRLRRLPCRSS